MSDKDNHRIRTTTEPSVHTIDASSCVPTTRSELIIADPVLTERSKNLPDGRRYPGTGALSWKAIIVILATVLGAPFAFAAGLRVHPIAASAIAIAVFGLLACQLWRRS